VDKPAGLTRDERDRAEAHTLVTDQLLRRLPYTATLADIACGAHERMDGSGITDGSTARTSTMRNAWLPRPTAIRP